MKPTAVILLLALWLAPSGRADIRTDWAYHSAGLDGRLADTVPGKSMHFLDGGRDQMHNDQTVRIYLITAHNFAGDMDEQVFVRWWDGAMAHWIMGQWVDNLHLQSDPAAGRFRNQPLDGTVDLDLWKIEIPSEVTRPGENFYAIQLKAFSPETTAERYLLSRPGGDFTHTNNLGQIWSASEEFDGQDWKVNIWKDPLPPPAEPE